MSELPDKITVVIPSYQPDEKLFGVLEGLAKKGFQNIVVVDDGSGETYAPIFERASCLLGVSVLVHPENLGKGAALKTAFAYCLKEWPENGVVTVDGDNQHHAEDVLACCRKMCEETDSVILGTRNFSAAEVPFRSRLGNILTKEIFRLVCGVKIADTQTGLRAVPAGYLPIMLEIEGSRYEYETNMLLELKKRGIPFAEVPIRTIYLDENSSSHFAPFRDSLRIFRTICFFGVSSVLAGLLDLFVFYLGVSLLARVMPGGIWNIAAAAAGARICSSAFNYRMNRRKVFGCGERNAVLKYYALCILQFGVSAGAVSLLAAVFPAGSLEKTLLKAGVDMLLFFLSYQIQREWVFREKRRRTFPACYGSLNL